MLIKNTKFQVPTSDLLNWLWGWCPGISIFNKHSDLLNCYCRTSPVPQISIWEPWIDSSGKVQTHLTAGTCCVQSIVLRLSEQWPETNQWLGPNPVKLTIQTHRDTNGKNTANKSWGEKKSHVFIVCDDFQGSRKNGRWGRDATCSVKERFLKWMCLLRLAWDQTWPGCEHRFVTPGRKTATELPIWTN